MLVGAARVPVCVGCMSDEPRSPVAFFFGFLKLHAAHNGTD